MSDIRGEGYGSKHNWQRGRTNPSKYTIYQCRSCGCDFAHHYDWTPDIFKAMEIENVSEHCTVTKEKNDE